MKELQKEVDQEIKREINEGKIDLNKSLNKGKLSSLNTVKHQENNRQIYLNRSMVEPGLNDMQKLAGIGSISKKTPKKNKKAKPYMEHNRQISGGKKGFENTIAAEK